MQSFLSQLQKRRSIYALNKTLPVSQADIVAIIQQLVRHTPSSFNSQSSRAMILFGAEHEKLWNIVLEGMKKAGVSGEALKASEQKVNGCFASGAGTVLFFEDQKTIKGLQEQLPLYAKNFPIFAEQSNGMTQLAVWTALAQEGVGATLQHYNELIEEDVRKQFGVSADWKLIAQMPFGGIAGPAEEKTFIPDEGRVIVKGLSNDNTGNHSSKL